MRATETDALARLLGGISAAQFMRLHWQKSPRLIRGAVPDFNGIVDRKTLFALAGRDDVESRLIVRGAGPKRDWTLEHGPFRAADFKAMPPTNWTLLVQGVDQHLDAGAALLQRFAFLPFARLDDLMISYAVPGGGVGPHFDSYDVFLLQGQGRRRWRVSDQADLRLQPDMPLKILSHFKPTAAWDLDPGDMLYLPPSIAHDGVAITECMTYSIGFRAPTAREMVERFLQHLPDVIDVADGRYGDPDLRSTTTPARIDARMQRRLARMLASVRWDRTVVDRFVGAMLSEPAASAIFQRPHPPMSWRAFNRAVGNGATLALDRRARMLYDGDRIYVNGEDIGRIALHSALLHLADARTFTPAGDKATTALPEATLRALYEQYTAGVVHVDPG